MPYNSQGNGVVERSHFIIRESIKKACKGKISQWPSKVHAAFHADRITVTKSTGCSPYYLLYGTEPALPLDLFESTFLVKGFREEMSREDLLALRIRQLEKRDEDIEKAAQLLAKMRFKSKQQFEKRFKSRLSQTVFQAGDLVLLRNSEIEKNLDRKSYERYLGPMKVVERTATGAYKLQELDGTEYKAKIAPFRLLPYIQ